MFWPHNPPTGCYGRINVTSRRPRCAARFPKIALRTQCCLAVSMDKESISPDRLCVVVSGIWWVNSGNDFDPDNCVPTPAGGYIRRVAGTPHYDGVIASGKDPA